MQQTDTLTGRDRQQDHADEVLVHTISMGSQLSAADGLGAFVLVGVP